MFKKQLNYRGDIFKFPLPIPYAKKIKTRNMWSKILIKTLNMKWIIRFGYDFAGSSLEPNIALGKHGWMIREEDICCPASYAFDGITTIPDAYAKPIMGAGVGWLAVDLERTMSILRTVVYVTSSGRISIYRELTFPIQQFQHFEAEAKRMQFCRRHFQMYFPELKCMNSD